jgi:hypothetical protein
MTQDTEQTTPATNDGKEPTIAIIGLGYVGLPLAVEFGKIRKTIGFDINLQRVEELRSGNDSTLEVEPAEIQEATHLKISDNAEDMRQAGIFIVTVPTPIDQNRAPDLTPLISASRTIGQVISKGAIVIYESTVYPGATEEDCIPIIEATSGLRYNVDFFAGYSPERINPGDKLRPLPRQRRHPLVGNRRARRHRPPRATCRRQKRPRKIRSRTSNRCSVAWNATNDASRNGRPRRRRHGPHPRASSPAAQEKTSRRRQHRARPSPAKRERGPSSSLGSARG